MIGLPMFMNEAVSLRASQLLASSTHAQSAEQTEKKCCMVRILCIQQRFGRTWPHRRSWTLDLVPRYAMPGGGLCSMLIDPTSDTESGHAVTPVTRESISQTVEAVGHAGLRMSGDVALSSIAAPALSRKSTTWPQTT